MSSWLDDLNKESLEGHKGALKTLIENAEEKVQGWRKELSDVERRLKADDEPEVEQEASEPEPLSDPAAPDVVNEAEVTPEPEPETPSDDVNEDGATEAPKRKGRKPTSSK